MIAEQKFGVECDSPEMQRIYALARERSVPVLMHWQFGTYNTASSDSTACSSSTRG